MNELVKICEAIRHNNGVPLLVGGCVRDKIMGIAPKDFDVEVYNLETAPLVDILRQFGIVNLVGVSFGVIKLRTPQGQEFDFSLPRRENKQGRGHKGFQVEPDPTMTPKEAAARRDFTFNSLAENPLNGEVFDFFNGELHLRMKMLEPTSEAFKEDPLRIMRGMQFAARFNMNASAKLIQYGKEMFEEYKELAIERVWGEWQKLCEKGKRPALGLELLREVGWLPNYPELNCLIGVPQDPEWHPEGDVFIHTLWVTDAAAEIADRDNIVGDARSILILAAICHDMGKVSTTVFERERWRSPGHAEAGVIPAESFLKRIGAPQAIAEKVIPLVKCHMAHCNMDSASPRSVRRLSLSVQPATIAELLPLMEADHSGRPPLPKGMPESAVKIGQIAAEQKVVANKVQPILQGRHLLEIGLTPSPNFGILLKRAFEAQVSGEFANLDEGKHWLASLKEDDEWYSVAKKAREKWI